MTEQAPDRWIHRRRRLDATMAGSFGMLVYLVGWGEDTTIHRIVAEGLLWSLSSLLLGYIVAPVADDWLQKRKGDTT